MLASFRRTTSASYCQSLPSCKAIYQSNRIPDVLYPTWNVMLAIRLLRLPHLNRIRTARRTFTLRKTPGGAGPTLTTGGILHGQWRQSTSAPEVRQAVVAVIGTRAWHTRPDHMTADVMRGFPRAWCTFAENLQSISSALGKASPRRAGTTRQGEDKQWVASFPKRTRHCWRAAIQFSYSGAGPAAC